MPESGYLKNIFGSRSSSEEDVFTPSVTQLSKKRPLEGDDRNDYQGYIVKAKAKRSVSKSQTSQTAIERALEDFTTETKIITGDPVRRNEDRWMEVLLSHTRNGDESLQVLF